MDSELRTVAVKKWEKSELHVNFKHEVEER